MQFVFFVLPRGVSVLVGVCVCVSKLMNLIGGCFVCEAGEGDCSDFDRQDISEEGDVFCSQAGDTLPKRLYPSGDQGLRRAVAIQRAPRRENQNEFTPHLKGAGMPACTIHDELGLGHDRRWQPYSPRRPWSFSFEGPRPRCNKQSSCVLVAVGSKTSGNARESISTCFPHESKW